MRFVVTVSALLCLVTAVYGVQTASNPHHFMFMQYSPGNKLIEMSADGRVLWEHDLPSLGVMFQIVKNGHVIYAYGGNPTGVQEVDREHHVVWNYTANCEQVLGFSLMPNGNVLVGEEGPCRAVEVNRKGEEVRTTPLTTFEKPAHRQLRSVHALPDGHIIASHEGDGVIREYGTDGSVVWEYPRIDSVFEAIRLRNGNTLIGGGKTATIWEVTPKGEVVWSFGPKDAPELGLAWITGIQILKNGNLVAANFLQGKEGSGVHAFEVTRDKKVLWTYADHQRSHLVTMAKFLDVKGVND